MPKPRAYGADSVLLVAQETTYGTAPTDNYQPLAFKSADLSAAIPLGDDPLLGYGRDAQDPYRGLITDEGDIEIPLDERSTGFWLTGLFGAPTETTIKASGYIAFSGQPAASSTITLNAVVWTFVSGAPTGNQTQIGADLDATLTALAADLNGSADVQISKCTYTANTTNDRLAIEFDTAGITGNSFTIAASANSNGTVSAATLTGGGYTHVWLSGAATIPSYTVEIGHPALTTPVFFRHVGVVLESLAFDLGTEGPANGRITAVAQGETSAAAPLDATPRAAYASARFSNGKGYIKKGGAQLASVTAGSFLFSNTLERVRTIRPDGKIDGADPTVANCSGSMTVRFDGTTLVAEASAGDPLSLEYGFTGAAGSLLKFEMPRVFLPKPKYSIGGPGGVEAGYDWRAAYDAATTSMLKVTLVNDVASYA